MRRPDRIDVYIAAKKGRRLMDFVSGAVADMFDRIQRSVKTRQEVTPLFDNQPLDELDFGSGWYDERKRHTKITPELFRTVKKDLRNKGKGILTTDKRIASVNGISVSTLAKIKKAKTFKSYK